MFSRPVMSHKGNLHRFARIVSAYYIVLSDVITARHLMFVQMVFEALAEVLCGFRVLGLVGDMKGHQTEANSLKTRHNKHRHTMCRNTGGKICCPPKWYMTQNEQKSTVTNTYSEVRMTSCTTDHWDFSYSFPNKDFSAGFPYPKRESNNLVILSCCNKLGLTTLQEKLLSPGKCMWSKNAKHFQFLKCEHHLQPYSASILPCTHKQNRT